MRISRVYLLIVFGAYVILSSVIFYNIYLTSNLVVDEEFHLPLGEQYCKFNFKVWDPKVTTLPGLYLISAAILGPFGLCSIFWLRAISLLFSCINFVLFYLLFARRIRGELHKVSSALAMSLLPPLYFLAHIYYTDVVSITTCLLFIILNEKGYHFPASIAGFLSVICRQTNILVVAMYGGKFVLTELYSAWAELKEPYRKVYGKFPVTSVKPFLKDAVRNPLGLLQNPSAGFWLNSLCYISILLFFAIFVFLNGGIVVGDRNAHNVTMNLPQIFYFSLFSLVFGWPHFVGEVLNFIQFTVRHKMLMIFLIAVSFVIVHFNTVVHPYLLADNRHLVFYVWSRFYGKYWWFRYALIPVYIFSLYVIVKTIWNRHDISFFIFYTVGVTTLLASQSLLEIRYFLVPYIILRLKMKFIGSEVFNVILEFVTYSVINMITLNIFFTKTLFWADMDYTQRIMW